LAHGRGILRWEARVEEQIDGIARRHMNEKEAERQYSPEQEERERDAANQKVQHESG
jgi:hypothetical protein